MYKWLAKAKPRGQSWYCTPMARGYPDLDNMKSVFEAGIFEAANVATIEVLTEPE